MKGDKMPDTEGLYKKYFVDRLDGQDLDGGKHFGCFLFVFDLTHDAHARKALAYYAEICEVDRPELARDLKRELALLENTQNA